MTEAPEREALIAAMPDCVSLGLWAPSLTEQGWGPFLADIEQFEADDTAISRLHVRGLLTYAQHVTARKKLSDKIMRALRP